SDPECWQRAQHTPSEAIPQSLLRGIVTTVNDRWYGLRSLALASLRGRCDIEPHLIRLPPIPGLAETDDQKLALVRSWIAQWSGPTAGIWFQDMDPSWVQTRGGIRPHAGKFASLTRWFGDRGARSTFEQEWLPILLERLCEPSGDKYRIRAGNLALDLEPTWGYCQACRTTQRPFPGTARCVACGRDRVAEIDPEDDPVFAARKG